MKTKPRFIAAMAVFCGTGFLISAANAGAPVVAASANWAIHLDLVEFRQTALGAAVARLPIPADKALGIAMARTLFDFDPHSDLHALTIYGPDKERENAVLLARGRFQPDRVFAFLQVAPRESFFEETHGAHRIIRWGNNAALPNPGGESGPRLEPGALSFHPSGVAVLASSQEQVRNALDLLDGVGERMVMPLPRNAARPYLTAFADLTRMENLRPDAALLRHADRIVSSVGETTGKLNIRLMADARTVAAARQIEAVSLGLQAYALLQTAGSAAGIPDWLLKTTVVRDDRTLHFYLDAPVECIAKFIEQQAGVKK